MEVGDGGGGGDGEGGGDDGDDGGEVGDAGANVGDAGANVGFDEVSLQARLAFTRISAYLATISFKRIFRLEKGNPGKGGAIGCCKNALGGSPGFTIIGLPEN